LFLQNYVGTNPAGHTWTLAVEEHFYLALPFALAALLALRRIQWIIPAALIAAPLCLGLRTIAIWSSDPYAIKMSASHLRLDALLFGVAIRGVAQFHIAIFEAFRPWRLHLFFLGIVLWLPNVFLDPGTFFVRTFGFTANFLGSAAFLIAAFHTHREDLGRLRPVIAPCISIVASVGVYSYGIYLWHVTAIGILERIAGGRIFRYLGHGELSWILSATVVTIGAIVVGVITSKAIEWPVLRLRDRFFPSRSGSIPEQQPRVVNRPKAATEVVPVA
jgi:peptidoglycan/LPS O-acetylase OafA/YrhL